MNRVTKSVLETWFNIYQSIVQEFKILEKNIYNIDESGFSIRIIELIQIIIDTILCTKYQVYPGYQKQISIIKYICRNRIAITLFGIFKDKNIFENWISPKVYNKQFFLANTKDWTSNLYRLEQLKYIFELVIYEKTDGQYYLFIYNNYNSYISKSFITHYLQNRIILLILPLYISHLL